MLHTNFDIICSFIALSCWLVFCFLIHKLLFLCNVVSEVRPPPPFVFSHEVRPEFAVQLGWRSSLVGVSVLFPLSCNSSPAWKLVGILPGRKPQAHLCSDKSFWWKWERFQCVTSSASKETTWITEKIVSDNRDAFSHSRLSKSGKKKSPYCFASNVEFQFVCIMSRWLLLLNMKASFSGSPRNSKERFLTNVAKSSIHELCSTLIILYSNKNSNISI